MYTRSTDPGFLLSAHAAAEDAVHAPSPRASTETPALRPALAPAHPSHGVDAAVRRAIDHLLALQQEDGHWCGELEGDSVVESEYALLLYFLGMGGDERAPKAVERIRRQRTANGAWSIYPGGPPEVSASVKAYFVLKLFGDAPHASHMVHARRTILELGGAHAVNTYTRIYLAVFGQYPWEGCPAIPPEMMLLPKWFRFNVHEMSSWSRAIFVPLSIMWALKPQCPVPDGAGIDELYVGGAQRATGQDSHGGHGRRENRFHAVHTRRKMLDPGERDNLRRNRWASFFRSADRILKIVERRGCTPLRRRGLRAAEAWILERLDRTDGLGAVFPAIVNTIFAFRCLGYPMNHPALDNQLRALEKLELDDGDVLKIQPSLSPVWDTAQALNALQLAGLPAGHGAEQRAAEWLLARESRVPGDWARKLRCDRVGGWYFQYANEFYPDCDDTAAVLNCLDRARLANPARQRALNAARRRGVEWLLSMQNADGGWGAFDRGCDLEALTFVPFADHNAMIDPSCEDITGRVLETLATEGFDPSHAAIRRGIEYLERRQNADGTWYGRWGCNYIYGTWLALTGLASVGVDMSQQRFQRAADWLRSRQNPDGGWGETLGSYDDLQLKGSGPSTAAQTAWALMALFATGDHGSDAVQEGIAYLTGSQQSDGSWDDEHWTGTGFPKVFYLRYHLYDDYFPLLALALYRHHAARRGA
jgi:squalene-hopene/tetraprenyl-beta-curcumene cyclase